MAKERPDEKGMHDGHRARVIDSYSRIELSDLAPHQVLEYILFFVFPRGDVNPLAHRLLEKYGTVQNVLDANIHSLKEVYGINERAAKMITGFVRIFDYYMNSKNANKTRVVEWTELYDTCEDLVRFQNREVVYGIALDASFRIINKRRIASGSVASVSTSTNIICDFINETHAAYVCFTHNHPGGSCLPSPADDEQTKVLKDISKIMHAKFIDHLVVGIDGIYSLNNAKKVRSFFSSEDVKEIAKLYTDNL